MRFYLFNQNSNQVNDQSKKMEVLFKLNQQQ